MIDLAPAADHLRTSFRGMTWAQKSEARQLAYREQALVREAEQVAIMDSMSDCAGLCYFFASADDRVKIGYSGCVSRRLRQVRYTTAYRTIVAATARGGMSRETHYHARFAEHRLEGEWFTLHPDIIDEIDRLRPLNPENPTRPPARLNTGAVA